MVPYKPPLLVKLKTRTIPDGENWASCRGEKYLEDAIWNPVVLSATVLDRKAGSSAAAQTHGKSPRKLRSSTATLEFLNVCEASQYHTFIKTRPCHARSLVV